MEKFDTKNLEKTLNQWMLDELLTWRIKYDITIQMYDGDFNIYISKNDINLYCPGGYEDLWEAIQDALNWLNKVNPSPKNNKRPVKNIKS